MSAVAKKRKTQRTEPGNSPLILIVLGVGLLIIGWMAVSASMNTATGRVGSAPDFTATTLTGETVRLSDYRGQIVMLNFWATWCPPCRAEMPAIERAYERYSEQGVMVLAINNGETSAEVAPFATTLGLRFPVVLDTDRRLQTAFGMTGYPTSLFIGRDGEIYATHTGGLSSSQLTNYLETGLAQPSA